MAAHENHPQLVVAQLLVERGVVARTFRGLRERRDDLVGLVAEDAVAADGVDRRVVRHAEQPAGRVVGRALIRPRPACSVACRVSYRTRVYVAVSLNLRGPFS